MSLPVDGNGHHVEQRGRNIAVEEEWEDLAQRLSKHPGLVDVPGNRKGGL